MSSRRGECGYRAGSAVQFPRRSCRERQAIYMSLDENFLLGDAVGNSLLRSLVNQANKTRESINNSYVLPHANFRYSTRSKDRIYLNVTTSEQTDDDEDFENRVVYRKFRKKRSLKPPSPDVEEIHSPGSDSPTEDQKNVQQDAIPTTSIKQEVPEPSMYESVKQRHQATRQAALPAKRKAATSLRRRPWRKGHLEEQSVAAEEGDSMDDTEHRHYALRSRVKPVERFHIDPAPARTFHLPREITSRRHTPRKRLLCRSDSDSSSSAADQDEAHFEQRRLRKMNKTRAELRPVNDGDLSYTVGLRDMIRRRTGTGADVDPMQIDRNIDFSKIGGLEQQIHSLKEVVLFPLLYPELFSRYSVEPPKGILFYGPPGTGKTLVARALANACSTGSQKVAFFMRKGADILSKWVGESERQLRMLFEKAYSMRPSIIFFDEIDGLTPARNVHQDQIHSSIVSTLLALMDGIDNRGEVVIIGATNRLDAIDPALRRPGRFDRELSFRLPDKSGRLEILQIHTSSWNDNQPSSELLEWLSERTSGYCGADLKSLCSEAVFISLRSNYPQIYSTNEKISIDPDEVKVEKKDFEIALRRIVPAGRRDLTVPSRILEDRLKILLEDTITVLIKNHIPEGYLGASKRNQGSCEIERILNAVNSGPVVPCARLLLSGASTEMGQTSYILPVIINFLDHLPVFSLSMSNLYSRGCPEESFSHSIQSAVRASSNGTPCILLITSIDVWFSSVPPSVKNMLLSAVDSFTGFTSILFLATANCSYTKLPPEIQRVFRLEETVEIKHPPTERLDAYFEHLIVGPACTPPTTFKIEDYPELPKANVIQPSKQLNSEEIEELTKLYKQYTLELTLHYEEAICRLSRDRRFSAFAQPIDPAEVPDYYTHIKNPMDLGTMFMKASTYKTPEECLNDFRLIHRNAIEYNPITDFEGRQIRNMAKVLLDQGQKAVMELDSRFLKRLEEMKKLLIENGVKVDDLCDDGEHSEKVNGSELDDTEIHGNGGLNTVVTEERKAGVKRCKPTICKLSRKRRNVKKTLKKCGSVHSAMNTASNDVEMDDGVRSEGDQPVAEDDKDVDSEQQMNIDNSTPTIERDVCKTNGNVEIDLNKLNEVIHMAVKKSRGWPLMKLERFAAGIMVKINAFHDQWDRTELPFEIEKMICNWNSSH